MDDPVNRARFTALAVLYRWIHASDEQVIYSTLSLRHVYSVDHGHLFPSGPEWSVHNLGHANPHSASEPIDRDAILTQVTLYWLTNTGGSSVEAYYEDNVDPGRWSGNDNSGVPTGVAVFADDVAIRKYSEAENTIVHWSEFDRGGHFAAMQAPDLLVQDIRTFFAGLR